MSKEVEKFTGGPAFPTCYQGPTYPIPFDGMSLRDYFAGEALKSLPVTTAAYDDMANGIQGSVRRAAVAYLIADAMLKERAK